MSTVVIIDDDQRHEVVGSDGAVNADSFATATGWELKPEGLCKGDICVPLRTTVTDESGRLIVAKVAEAMGRPVIADAVRGVVALGVPTVDRASSMASLQAPDFTLPDLDGNSVSLSDFKRRKVLLLAWSSW